MPSVSDSKGGDVTDCPLSARELECVSSLADGLLMKQIAVKHGVEVSTVRSQLHTAYRKLGVSNRVEAVLAASTNGWIDNPVNRAVHRLAVAIERLADCRHAANPLTEEQRVYLAAFDEMLFARSDRQKIAAREKMRSGLAMMLGEVPPDPVERIVSGLIVSNRRSLPLSVKGASS